MDSNCKTFLAISMVAYVVFSQIAAEEKKPLNNNPTFRGISDKLDSALGWGGYNDPKQSKVRGAIHAAYHEIQYHRTGNPRERERAKDQWGVVTGGDRNNLKRYDQQHGKN